MERETVKEASFMLGRVRIDVEITENGQLELYANDGILLIEANTGNVVRIEVRRHWDLSTRMKIVQNIVARGKRTGKLSGEVAKEILDVVEGRS